MKDQSVVSEKTSDTMAKIKEARTSSKPRRFKQSWDFSISLKNIDLKKPENRFNIELILPANRGKENRIVVITDTFATDVRKIADRVVTKSELEALAGNKKKLKELANSYDWFLGEVSLMPMIGKILGSVLGPRGKSPKPIPPNIKIEPFIQAAKKTIRISLKDNPVINTKIGTEEIPDEDVAKNAEAVLNLVIDKLPKGRNNIRHAFIKLTMGKPVKVEV